METTKATEKVFLVYVNVSDVESGYLRIHYSRIPLTTAFRDAAHLFSSLTEATSYIASRGWENSTSVILGKVTAYACEL